MGTTETKGQLAAVPVEDGSIAAAIAELDRKLSSWVQAMEQAHATLRRPAAAPLAGGAVPSASTPSTDRPPMARPVAEKQTQPAPTKKDAEKTGQGGPSAAGTVKKPVGGKPNEPSPADGRRKPAHDSGPPAGSSAAESGEDEMLLARLEPAKARAIRIKRRLGNNQKSVRELLEEG